MTGLDMDALVTRALQEGKTITEALELVERVKALVAPPAPAAAVVVATPAPRPSPLPSRAALQATTVVAKPPDIRQALEDLLSEEGPQQTELPLQQPEPPPAKLKRRASQVPRGYKQWLPEEIARAEALLDNGLTVPEVAVKSGRTTKAVHAAIGRGAIKSKAYVPDIRRQAASYEAAIARGMNLKDWERAQTVIDAKNGVTGKPLICTQCSREHTMNWSKAGQPMLCYECATSGQVLPFERRVGA